MTWDVQHTLEAAGGSVDDAFGFAVAIEGDRLVIGAPYREVGVVYPGAIYVFARNPSTGQWTQEAELHGSDAVDGDLFGYAVALSGTTIVVGASAHNPGAGASAGAAYVFVKSGVTWTQQAKLVATGGATQDTFGTAVALIGDTAVIGAPGRGANTGAAYVFTRSGAVWSQQVRLDGDAAGDTFGTALALTSGTLLVGAPGVGPGYARVFAGSGASWPVQATLGPSGPQTGDHFGFAVSLSGDTAAIGASGRDPGAQTDAGEVFVFTRSGVSWTLQAVVTPAGVGVGDVFGSAVGLAGNILVSGFPYHAPSAAGAAAVFKRSGSAWSQAQAFGPATPAAFQFFGYAVAISGTTLVVGAPFHDGSATALPVYVFEEAPVGKVAPQVITALAYSLYRWIRSAPYAVGAGPNLTLLQHFPQLTILPAFPSDLTKIQGPTLAVGNPATIKAEGFFFGEAQEQLWSMELYGFVKGQGSDHSNRLYRDRLANDVFWLFNTLARESGVPLFDQASQSEISAIEVTDAELRFIPETEPQVEADRFRFGVALELGYDTE